jgi:hypothetical protein
MPSEMLPLILMASSSTLRALPTDWGMTSSLSILGFQFKTHLLSDGFLIHQK